MSVNALFLYRQQIGQVRFCCPVGPKIINRSEQNLVNTWVHILTNSGIQSELSLLSTFSLCNFKLNCNSMLPLQIFIAPNIFFKDIIFLFWMQWDIWFFQICTPPSLCNHQQGSNPKLIMFIFYFRSENLALVHMK